MPGHIVGSPISSVFPGVVRRAVGYGCNQHPFFRQQRVQRFPSLIQRFKVLHYVPQRNDIKTIRFKILQSRIGLYLQAEMFLGKSACMGVLFNGFHLPAATLHCIGKITGSRADVQQTSCFTMRFMRHQARLALQHIAAHPMVYGVHHPFLRI